jgi:tetratricopeptide (TPR) repeat protein
MQNPPVTFNLLQQAVAYHRAGNLASAESLYLTLLASDPEDAQVLTLLGTIHAQRGNYEDGIGLLDKAVLIKPDHAEAYFNRALARQMLGRYEEALEDYTRAVKADPSYAEAHWHKSLVHLTLGEYEEGWKEYEWRWKTRPEAARHFHHPLWAGESGKTILVHAEQGFGDTLQFCRYLPLVAEKNRVIFESYPAAQYSGCRRNNPAHDSSLSLPESTAGFHRKMDAHTWRSDRRIPANRPVLGGRPAP